jgi:hypothetical protein
LVQRAKAAAVHSVMVGGDWVYQDRKFTRIDRDAVLADIAARFARPLSADEVARQALARDVMPHVRQFYRGYLAELDDDPHCQRPQPIKSEAWSR